MQTRSMIVMGVVFVVLLLLSSMLYVVKETERAVVLRFGKLANADVSPGLQMHRATLCGHGRIRFPIRRFHRVRPIAAIEPRC